MRGSLLGWYLVVGSTLLGVLDGGLPESGLWGANLPDLGCWLGALALEAACDAHHAFYPTPGGRELAASRMGKHAEMAEVASSWEVEPPPSVVNDHAPRMLSDQSKSLGESYMVAQGLWAG